MNDVECLLLKFIVIIHTIKNMRLKKMCDPRLFRIPELESDNVCSLWS